MLLAARRSSDPAFLYVEGEDFIVRVSRGQLSSIFPKRAPFVTGSYLDEIALAAVLAAPAPLVVLGGSFGSAVPLCARVAPGAPIVTVDRDPEAARVGQHFCAQVLDRAPAIEWRTERAEDFPAARLGAAGAVFVDLYEPQALSPFALDARLHDAVGGVALVNVFDPRFEAHGECATRAAIHALSASYSSFVVARRRLSSVVIAARAPIAERVAAALARLAGVGVSAAHVIETTGAPPSRTDLFALVDMPAPEGGDALIDRARREIAGLDVAKWMALLRAPSRFLV